MFGYRNPLQRVQEFELSNPSQPYDEINLNLVEDFHNTSSSINGKGFGNNVATNMDDLQSFHVVNGGLYKKLVHAVASIDIMYSLFRLAFHFLELITGGLGTQKHNRSYSYESNLSEDPSSNNSTDENAEAVKRMTPFALSQVSDEKTDQSLIVAIWSGKFIVCIIQLIVASALYSGTTNLKDSRISIRNCRIWMWTAIMLIILLTFELCGIFIIAESSSHVIAIVTCICEIMFRAAGIALVWKFIKQLKFQLCDLEQDEHIIYYELCPSPGASTTPSTSRAAAAGPSQVIA